jgi:ABC-2 type transport system ATP-binding protein/lipopolysaccharide transport system ATP-binding protein
MNAIIFENVSKRFRRYSHKAGSIREAFLKGLFLNLRRNDHQYLDVLRNISFSVPMGSTFGIIGKNGSGKTTLLRLIAGVLQPENGLITVRGKIVLLSLGLGFHPELTGRENIFISGVIYGLTPRRIKRQLNEIIDFSELDDFIDAPVRTYSSGMQARLAFSIAVNVDLDILLLDEIMAVGDSNFIKKCLARMEDFKKSGKTIILASHSDVYITKWCSEVIWIDNGNIAAIGEPQKVIAMYQQSFVK